MTWPATPETFEAITHRLEGAAERAAKKEVKKRLTAVQIEAAAYLRTFTRQTRAFAAEAARRAEQGDAAGARTWAKHALRAHTNLARITEALQA